MVSDLELPRVCLGQRSDRECSEYVYLQDDRVVIKRGYVPMVDDHAIVLIARVSNNHYRSFYQGMVTCCGKNWSTSATRVGGYVVPSSYFRVL